MDRNYRLKKLEQASMNLATNFDEVGATQQVVMNDHRDFSRPREPFYIGIAPMDSSSVSDDPSISADNDTIKQFQTYFGLPPTGLIDSKLISAAKMVEDKIFKATSNSAVKGLLWDDTHQKFNTTVADVQQALKRLQDFQSSKIDK